MRRHASWVDEILFQSGKDPRVVSNAKQAQAIMAESKPLMLILPEDKYTALADKDRERLAIISRDIVSTHPLTPGYLVERLGKIADKAPMVVAANYKLFKK